MPNYCPGMIYYGLSDAIGPHRLWDFYDKTFDLNQVIDECQNRFDNDDFSVSTISSLNLASFPGLSADQNGLCAALMMVKNKPDKGILRFVFCNNRREDYDTAVMRLPYPEYWGINDYYDHFGIKALTKPQETFHTVRLWGIVCKTSYWYSGSKKYEYVDSFYEPKKGFVCGDVDVFYLGRKISGSAADRVKKAHKALHTTIAKSGGYDGIKCNGLLGMTHLFKGVKIANPIVCKGVFRPFNHSDFLSRENIFPNLIQHLSEEDIESCYEPMTLSLD